MLKQSAERGEIHLKYLDKSGFCLWSPVSYSYSPVVTQKRMEQTVVVQDNGSIHKSQIVQAQWIAWAEQGLIMFFLPPIALK